MQVLPKTELGRTKGQRPCRLLTDLVYPDNMHSDLGD